MKRVWEIVFGLPDISDFQMETNDYLFKLLGLASNFKVESDGSFSIHDSLFPKTIVKRVNNYNPYVSFSGGDLFDEWRAGVLRFGFNIKDIGEGTLVKKEFTLLKDKVGEYVSSKVDGKEYFYLTLKQLFERLRTHIIEINHAGFNLTPALLKHETYLQFKKLLSQSTNLYNYPTGQEWSFVIPSTDTEFINDITDESVLRIPNLELVYDAYYPVPVIQLDITTDLDCKEAEELFPAPYGSAWENLKKYMRNVYIFNDYGGVIFRADIRFKKAGKDFTYWIVKKGGRII